MAVPRSGKETGPAPGGPADVPPGAVADGPPAVALTTELLSEVYRHPIRVLVEDDGSVSIRPERAPRSRADAAAPVRDPGASPSPAPPIGDPR